MKKNLLLLFTVVALATLAYFFVFQNKNSLEDLESTRNFRIENPEELGRVFIAQKGQDPIDLKLKKGTWYINDKYKANQSSINGIKDFFINNRIKFIPSKAATNNIVNEIAKIGIKVEAFDRKGKLLKSFYVGGNTPDERGSYFLMQHADQPYVLELPGMVAVLRERFLRTFDEWRSNEVFAYNTNDIVEIGVAYPKDKNYSFKIKREDGLSVEPYYPNAVNYFENPVEDLIESYVADYNFLFAEGYENNRPEKDSIMQLVPFAQFSIKDKTGDLREFNLYTYNDVYKPHHSSNPISLATVQQVERFFLSDNNGDFYVVQIQLIKKLLRSYDYFFANQSN